MLKVKLKSDRMVRTVIYVTRGVGHDKWNPPLQEWLHLICVYCVIKKLPI